MVGFVRFIDKLSLWVGHCFSWCIMILILGVSYEVFVRYVLGAPTAWAFDLSYIMYGALFMMCGAYTLSVDGHVRADMIYRKMSPRAQARLEVTLYFLFFFPGVIALIYVGTGYAAQSWRYLEVSSYSPANIPIYPLKSLIPLTGFFLLLQGIAEVMRCIMCLRDGHWPRRLHDVEEIETAVLHVHEDETRVAGERPHPMTDPQLAILMLGALLAVIMLGFPIAFSLLALGLFFGFYAMDFRIFNLLVEKTNEVMTNDVLVALPLFLFMGYMVERSNILDRLFRSIQIAARHLPGSIAVAALITCAMFATATGIVGAVVTLMGVLAYPAMLKARYDPRLSAGVICAGGTLGILIPPSVMLILYGATAGESVVRLYAAALLPGFLLAGMYVVYVVARAIRNPALAPKLPEEEKALPLSQVVLLLLTSFFPLAVLILAVLGAIMFGLATPSEAAAIGALGSMVLAISYGAMTWDRLREAVYLTGRTSAMVCFLFVGSGCFAAIFAYLNGHALVQETVQALNLSPIMFLILAQFIIFLLGWPLEWTEIIVIFVPIFLPLLDHFGIDPILFGVLIALNLQTSFLTPPVAMSAVYLKGVAPPGVTLTEIQKGCLPFLWIVLVSMVVIYVFPGVALWLPSTLYN